MSTLNSYNFYISSPILKLYNDVPRDLQWQSKRDNFGADPMVTNVRWDGSAHMRGPHNLRVTLA